MMMTFEMACETVLDTLEADWRSASDQERMGRLEKEDSGDTAHRFKYRSSRVLGNVGQGKHQLQKRGGP